MIRDLREQISEIDGAIVDAVNRRLELVAELKRYKDLHGISFVDPERERSLVDQQLRANRGPLSKDGLHELFEEILDLTKREVRRGEEEP